MPARRMILDKTCRVLVVDDDPTNVAIVEEILSDITHLRSAPDGETALALMPGWHPDIILLDIMMPGIDGYETCRRIRGDDRYRATKVILVSGKASVDERLAGYAAGADDYIVKPFVDDELLAKVRVFGRLGRTEVVDRLRRDILRVFSHETRTPLNAILGLATLVTEDETLPDEFREDIGNIARNGRTLLEFVRKAELLSDLKSGLALDAEPGCLTDVVNVLVDRHRSAGTAPFAVTAAGGDQVIADWRLVTEALEAVLANAVKFGAGRPVEVAVSAVADGYEVTVADRGPGIAPAHVKHIGEPFGVWDVNHHHRGHGLSLAITREVLEHHGGYLEVENRPDGGAVFTLGLARDPQATLMPHALA